MYINANKLSRMSLLNGYMYAFIETLLKKKCQSRQIEIMGLLTKSERATYNRIKHLMDDIIDRDTDVV